MQLKVKPEPFQVDGINFLSTNKWALLGDEMGLGKTLQAIAVCNIFGGNILVIAPASLKINWLKEFNKLSAKPHDIYLCRNIKEIPKEPNRTLSDIIIINYEMLPKAEHLFKWASIVIADEIHYIKNVKIDRTKAIHQYMEDYRPDRFMGLSGTPINNNVPEFYSPIRLCSYSPHKPRTKFMSFITFCKTFTHEKRGFKNHRIYKGIRNIPLLKDLLKGIYLRRLTEGNLDLPEFINKDIYLEIEDFNSEELQTCWDSFNSVKDRSIIAKVYSATLKASYTAEYCKELFDQGEGPLIVFSSHLEPLQIIKRLSKCKTEVIDGSTSLKERDRIVTEFQEGKIDLLLGSTKACGTGFTLTKAKNVIFNDLDWTPAYNMQAKKRIHRIGQRFRCVCHRILGSQIDERICHVLDEKEEILRKAL